MTTRAKRLRTWVCIHDFDDDNDPLWIAELGEGRYLRCNRDGRLMQYTCPIEPYATDFEEVT